MRLIDADKLVEDILIAKKTILCQCEDKKIDENDLLKRSNLSPIKVFLAGSFDTQIELVKNQPELKLMNDNGRIRVI